MRLVDFCSGPCSFVLVAQVVWPPGKDAGTRELDRGAWPSTALVPSWPPHPSCAFHPSSWPRQLPWSSFCLHAQKQGSMG